MRDWREVCADLELGSSVQKPAGRWETDEYTPPDKGGDPWGSIDPASKETYEYIIAAANHADRMARFARKLAQHIIDTERDQYGNLDRKSGEKWVRAFWEDTEEP